MKYTIENQWLQVTVKASTATGLDAGDVFYFGNAVAESGNSPGSGLPAAPHLALVNATDVVGARDNPRGPMNPAVVTDRFDFNRDGNVDALDMVFARNAATSPLSAVPLATPVLVAPVAEQEGNSAEPEPATGAVAADVHTSSVDHVVAYTNEFLANVNKFGRRLIP